MSLTRKIKIVVFFLLFNAVVFIAISCDEGKVKASDLSFFDIGAYYDSTNNKVKLKYGSSMYTDSTAWPLELPTFDWILEYGRRINNYNLPDEIRYDSKIFLDSTQKWSSKLPDSLLSGTNYFYFQGECNNGHYVGYAREGLNFFRISFPDTLFLQNTNDSLLDIASTYMNVPYVWGNAKFKPSIGDTQIINKTKRQGYFGIDCSGLVNWSLLKNGNPLQFTGVDSAIVGNKNSHAIWQQANTLQFTAVGWGAWVDGVVYFLDVNHDSTVDHCGFWYDDGSIDGKTLHAIGEPYNKVIFQKLRPEYHNEWFYDAAYIYSKKSGRQKNEIARK